MSSTVVTSTQAQSKQRWVSVVFLVVVLGMIAVTARQYFSQCDTFDCPSVTMFIEGFGPWAPLAYAVIYVASSPVPFLAVVLSAAGGLLFGATWGTLYALVVATLSSLVPFFLARRLGREWVESKLRGKKLGDIYQQSSGKDGFVFVVLMRLIPVLPWEVQNYTAGLTNVSVPTFVLATLLGAIPGTFSNVLLGSSAMDVGSWKFTVAVALNAVIILMPLIAIYVRSRRNKNKGAI
jgi:uncharacterized membrane protein YdjX (TVP38/TMEM64 family)